MAQSCIDIANKLIERLKKLRAAEERGKRRVWSSVSAALQEVWGKSELELLLKTLREHQEQLKFYVLASVR